MPVVMNRSRRPTRWLAKSNGHGAALPYSYEVPVHPIRIAIINNMSDPALEDTELQFLELLDAASGNIPVHVKLYSLSSLPRGDRGLQHLRDLYCGLDDLYSSEFDGVIVTGTEPRQSTLRQEPYWGELTDLLDWAERSTYLAVLSCLAAHAGVSHTDGIDRQPHADKQFGVFEERRVSDHLLTHCIPEQLRFPHSRWNGLPEDALNSCGYTVLTKSAEAGVNLFVKKKKKSLFVHFQGHPEYAAQTLLKEYRRDIKRFLRRERETYPSMPKGYFDSEATRLLADFRKNAISHRAEELLASFPEGTIEQTMQNTWQSFATRIYRNWLEYVRSRKAETSPIRTMAHAAWA